MPPSRSDRTSPKEVTVRPGRSSSLSCWLFFGNHQPLLLVRGVLGSQCVLLQYGWFHSGNRPKPSACISLEHPRLRLHHSADNLAAIPYNPTNLPVLHCQRRHPDQLDSLPSPRLPTPLRLSISLTTNDNQRPVLVRWFGCWISGIASRHRLIPLVRVAATTSSLPSPPRIHPPPPTTTFLGDGDTTSVLDR